MNKKTYSPITPAEFAAFRAQAEAQEIEVPAGNSGTVSTHDCTIGFNYDGTSKLDLEVTKLSFFAFGNYDVVWNALAPFLPAAK